MAIRNETQAVYGEDRAVMVTSDDEIRIRSQVEIPTGVRIHCEPMADGYHVLSVGGSILNGPRLVLDLGPGTADALLTAVRNALTA